MRKVDCMSGNTDKMKKIMFHLNSLGKGGAERVVSLLSKKLSEDGFDTVIATEWYESDEYVLGQKVRRIHVGLSEHDESASRLVKQWIRIRNLRRAILAEKPDYFILRKGQLQGNDGNAWVAYSCSGIRS